MKNGAMLINTSRGGPESCMVSDAICWLMILKQNADLKEKYSVQYTDPMTLCEKSDIITLHLGLVNTKDVINALKNGKIGCFGMDVYEEENGLFFEDHSEDIIKLNE